MSVIAVGNAHTGTHWPSLGPTPKNRPGTHCLRMRVINTLNVGIPTFRYTFRVRPLRVTSLRITLRCVSVHYTCAIACLQPSGFDSAVVALQRLGTPVLKPKPEQVAYIKCLYERRDVLCGYLPVSGSICAMRRYRLLWTSSA